MSEKTLLLIHEREADCLLRLSRQGIAGPRAAEISSYLAQSTDLAPEFAAISEACSAEGIHFQSITLDEFVRGDALPQGDVLAWTLTDGIAYFSGSVAPAIARLHGMQCVGAESALFALCQDKFRSGAVLQALGFPLPATALARNGTFVSPANVLEHASSYFVKPNRLGAKIGIYANSHCGSLDEAMELSRRIFTDYGDDAVVQAYVPGVNVRASWLDLDGKSDMSRLGIWRVEAEGDYQTMADSMALYGDSGAQAMRDGKYAEPRLIDLREERSEAAARIVDIAATLMQCLGIPDVCSLDFRIGDNGAVTLLEFEVCPGLPCFDFRSYVRTSWGMSLPEAMARIAGRLLG